MSDFWLPTFWLPRPMILYNNLTENKFRPRIKNREHWDWICTVHVGHFSSWCRWYTKNLAIIQKENKIKCCKSQAGFCTFDEKSMCAQGHYWVGLKMTPLLFHCRSKQELTWHHVEITEICSHWKTGAYMHNSSHHPFGCGKKSLWTFIVGVLKIRNGDWRSDTMRTHCSTLVSMRENMFNEREVFIGRWLLAPFS